MNALIGLLILTGIIYGIWVDATFWKIYAIVLTIYTIFVTTQKSSKENPKRKTVMISTWSCKCVLYSFCVGIKMWKSLR